jgi:hypothetical protein
MCACFAFSQAPGMNISFMQNAINQHFARGSLVPVAAHGDAEPPWKSSSVRPAGVGKAYVQPSEDQAGAWVCDAGSSPSARVGQYR